MTFETTFETTLPFRSLTREWAGDVARHLHRLAQASADPHIDVVWVTGDLALQVRYRLGTEKLATRVERLDVDPTSAREPSDSARLASDLLHTLHDAPADELWRDDRGYGWWGDEPAAGWAAIETGERLVTVPEHRPARLR